MKHLPIIALAALTLSACASTPYVPTLYDASTADVKTIAIADDALPEKIGANELASHTGTAQAAGGLIGFAVAAAMEGMETSSRVGNLAEILEPMGFDAEAEFEKMLTTKLAAAGYSGTNVIGGMRKKRGPLEAFPETTADAILDVHMNSFGMQKAKTGEEWRPAAGVTVQLVSTADDSILMDNVISYNSGVTGSNKTEGIIVMSPAADSVGYMKIKEMEGPVVVAEMRKMMDEISTTIVSLLK
jgi:hypothetical protein